MPRKALSISVVIALLTLSTQASILYRSGDPTKIGFKGYFLDQISPTSFNINLRVNTPAPIYALGTQPGTNALFGISSGFGTMHETAVDLVSINPNTGAMDLVVEFNDPTVDAFYTGMTFTSDGSLFVVATSASDFAAGTILQVNVATGGLMEKFNGSGLGSQELAFNPNDGLFYHFYNTAETGGTASLETIDPNNGHMVQVPLMGFSAGEVDGVVYAGEGKFMAYNNLTGNLMQVTTAGEVSLLHSYGDAGKYLGDGLALDTYVPEPASMLLLAGGSLAMLRRRRITA